MVIITTGAAPTVTLGAGTSQITLTHPQSYDLLGDNSIWDVDDIVAYGSEINAAIAAGTIAVETADGETLTEVPTEADSAGGGGIQSVNGKTGAAVTVSAQDVGAATPGDLAVVAAVTTSAQAQANSNSTAISGIESDVADIKEVSSSAIQPGDNVSALTNDAAYIDAAGAPVQSVNGQTGAVTVSSFSGDYNDLTNKPTLGTAADNDESDFLQPGDNVSELVNNVPYHTVHKQLINISGRMYGFSNERWVTTSPTYGPTYYQWFENGGTGGTPLVEWEHLGFLLPAGTVIRHVTLKGMANSSQFTGIRLALYTHDVDPTDYSLTIDSDGEGNATQALAPTDIITGITNGNMQDMRMGRIENVNYVMPQANDLLVYLKPLGNLSSTRYFYFTLLIEVEIP